MSSQLNLPKKLVFYAAGTFCAIVATFIHVDMLIVLTIALFAAPFISHIMGRFMFQGAECTRHDPPIGAVGQPLQIPITVRNRSSMPKVGLQIRDVLPPKLRSKGDEAYMVPSIMPGKSVEADYELVPTMRGLFRLGPLEFRGTDPLGLTRYSSFSEPTVQLVVYPSPLPIAPLGDSRQGLSGWSPSDSGRTRGIGGEFFGVREYVYGDEPKHVHWRSTAKRGKLVVSESARGDTGIVAVVLDCGSVWGTASTEPEVNPFERSIVAAVTAAWSAIQGSFPVLLLTGDSSVSNRVLADKLDAVQDTLARVQPLAQNDILRTLGDSRSLLDRASGIICISSDRSDTSLLPGISSMAGRGAWVISLVFDTHNRSTMGNTGPQRDRGDISTRIYDDTDLGSVLARCLRSAIASK